MVFGHFLFIILSVHNYYNFCSPSDIITHRYMVIDKKSPNMPCTLKQSCSLPENKTKTHSHIHTMKCLGWETVNKCIKLRPNVSQNFARQVIIPEMGEWNCFVVYEVCIIAEDIYHQLQEQVYYLI